MTQKDLLQVWAEEGKAALEAKKSGMVLDLWKVVAERKVATFSHSHIVSNTLNGSRWTLEHHHVHFLCPNPLKLTELPYHNEILWSYHRTPLF